jgi:hypothetical protein
MGDSPVRVLSGGVEVAAATTALDGTYRIAVPAGDYELVTPCGEIRVPFSVRTGTVTKVDYACNAI